MENAEIYFVLGYGLYAILPFSFNQINYEGSYTDYSSENWPIKQFISKEYLGSIGNKE